MSRVGTSGDDNPDVRVYLPEHSDRVRAGHGGHIQISQSQVNFVRTVRVQGDGFCDAATVVYANGHDLQDPLTSPVYGDMHRIPASLPDHRHTRPAAGCVLAIGEAATVRGAS